MNNKRNRVNLFLVQKSAHGWLKILTALILITALMPAQAQNNPHFNLRYNTVDLPTGVTLDYVEKGHGKGKVILFLHGYVASQFSFIPIMERLGPQYHAYALTQRGHGDSDKPLNGYAMSDFAADAASFMEAMGLESATIVGHSMGGVIAQRMAIDYPQKVEKLVLVGTGADMVSNPVIQNFVLQTPFLTDPIHPLFVAGLYLDMTYGPVDPDIFNTGVAESLKVPARIWQSAVVGLAAENTLPELGAIQIPTLLFWGDQDFIYWAPDQNDLLMGINGSELITYEDTGHYLHWEHPDLFTSDLMDFLH